MIRGDRPKTKNVQASLKKTGRKNCRSRLAKKEEKDRSTDFTASVNGRKGGRVTGKREVEAHPAIPNPQPSERDGDGRTDRST